jgi:hypothetical protein
MTLTQAQERLDALLAANASNMLTVSIGGRSVTYRSVDEITKQIAYWQRTIAGLQRAAAGVSSHAIAVARFK